MLNTQSSFPINFELYNEDEEPVLFITDDIAGQKMMLEITNTSNTPTLINKIEDVSAENHHFELIFRPGTLYSTPSAVKLEDTQFEMVTNKDETGNIRPNADGTLSLYFGATDNWTMNETEKVLITLNQIRAATQGGTRGTRVMLKYRNLLHAGNTAPFSGFRETHLNIVNHQGKRNIPLHVGFVGSNIVLNDGEHPNKLTLRVTNSSRKNVAVDVAAHSKLVLVADGGPPTDEWTLATDDQLAGMNVNVTYPNGTQQEVNKTPGGNEWEISFNTLNQGEFIDIQINNLITDHLTGQAGLYLHYEDIPRYWNGQFVAVVEKGPLVFSNKNVGIGENDPEGKLVIVPDSDAKGLEVRSPTAGKTHFPYVNNWNYISGTGVIFRQFLNEGDYTERVRIDLDSGNVGIGENDPEGKLVIVPDDDARGLEVRSSTAGNTHFPYVNNWNYISGTGVIFRHFFEGDYTERVRIDLGSGNVGIGENDPEGKLVIVPDGDAKGLEVLSPTAGKTHFPWKNNWNYISGDGVIFRQFLKEGDYTERVRIDLGSGNVGIGENRPKGKLAIVSDGDGIGLQVLSPTAGKTHFPWRNNWHYISGTGVIFRQFLDGRHTERVRIDLSSGNVGIGTVNPQKNLHIGQGSYLHPGIRIDGSAGTYWDIEVEANDQSDQDLLFVYKDGALPGKWASLWIEPKGGSRKPSDSSLKVDIEPMSEILEKILTLNPISFRWKSDQDPHAPKNIGFVAQEVEKVFPQLVKEKNGYKGLAYDDFAVLAVAAIKEQQDEISDLKHQLNEQQTMIQQLSTRLDQLEGK